MRRRDDPRSTWDRSWIACSRRNRSCSSSARATRCASTRASSNRGDSSIVSSDPRPQKDRDAPRRSGPFPDLGDVPANLLRSSFATRASVADVDVLGEPAHSHLFNLVRLAEKALCAYNAARAHFSRLSEGHAVVNVMGCTDRLEDCVDATYRGYLFVDAILDEQLEADPRFVVDDAVKIELRNMKPRRKSLRRLRDAMRRHEKQLRHTAGPTSGTTTSLSFDEANIVVGGHSLSYRDLERLVRTLHEITTAILQPEALPTPPRRPKSDPSPHGSRSSEISISPHALTITWPAIV
jgi:hypothetical protein